MESSAMVMWLVESVEFSSCIMYVHCMYTSIIGSYTIRTALAGARYPVEHIRTNQDSVLLGQIWNSIDWLLFELLVIVYASAVFLLYQNWALALIFLKIWARLFMLDRMMPLVDESWRIEFERVREYGFSRLQGLWFPREIVCCAIVQRDSMFDSPTITTLYTMTGDCYLTGQRLHNYGEDGKESQIEAGISFEVQNCNLQSNKMMENCIEWLCGVCRLGISVE
ncbi:hypothetical protein PTKIN_Ptkin03bG0004400 [Pterospermum kingtungense]